ncbi:hypothetical protein [Cupriavidus sp. 8B]
MRTSSSNTLPDYEVYAIHYARMPRDRADNFLATIRTDFRRPQA